MVNSYGSLTIEAYSKINLRLKVRGRRTDGFHILEMLNVNTSLSDQLEISVAKSGAPWLQIQVTECDQPDLKGELENVHRNLIGRAVQEVVLEFGVAIPSLTVKLNKRIPAGAGMGGGSADAAAMIRGLIAMLQKSLGSPLFAPGPALNERLMQLASRVGSDVPYLLFGGAAWVLGVGEQVVPIDCPELEGIHAILIVPNISTSTAEIYARLRERTPRMPVLSEIETRPQIASSYEEILSQIENDLEPVIIDTAPQLGKLLLECQEINSARSAFTGSGSVIFALPVSRAGFSEETAKQFRMLAQRRDARAIEVKLLTQKQQNCFICSNHNAI